MSPRPGAEVGGVTCDNLVSELQSVDGSHGTVHLWRHQDSEELCLLMTIVNSEFHSQRYEDLVYFLAAKAAQ